MRIIIAAIWTGVSGIFSSCENITNNSSDIKADDEKRKSQYNYETGRNPELPAITQEEADKLLKENLKKNNNL